MSPRHRNDDHFTVSTKQTRARTVKRVNFTWCCRPDESAEQIAAVLNAAVGDYLRGLSAARLERTPGIKRIAPAQPADEARPQPTLEAQRATLYQHQRDTVYQRIYQSMSEAERQSASAILREVRAERKLTKPVAPAAPEEALALLFDDVKNWKSKSTNKKVLAAMRANTNIAWLGLTKPLNAINPDEWREAGIYD